MKLIRKTQRYYLLFAPILLLLAGAFYYGVSRFLATEDAEERLRYIRQQVIKEIESGNIPKLDPLIHIKEAPADALVKRAYTDTIIYEPFEDEKLDYRQLRFTEHINGKKYLITLRHAIAESKPQRLQVLGMAIIILLILAPLFQILNSWLLQKLWNPFYNSLSAIKQYDLGKGAKLTLPRSDTDEFNELNMAIEEMTAKINRDYLSLKEFTENAAHEIQTPLAIIMSKIELLIQSSTLQEADSELLGAINDSTTRLARLNDSLLLLTKIENNQFRSNTEVNFNEIVQQQVDELEELAALRNLRISTEFSSAMRIYMNPSLAEILIRNLLRNAIRYSDSDTTIIVLLDQTYLEVINSGPPLTIPPEQLFDRFKKSNSAANSLGLGLAIVKQICAVHGHQAGYRYKAGQHIFSIEFS